MGITQLVHMDGAFRRVKTEEERDEGGMDAVIAAILWGYWNGRILNGIEWTVLL